MRAINLEVVISPAELRNIASYLEQDDCRKVNVNWYQTVLTFTKAGPWAPVEEPYRQPMVTTEFKATEYQDGQAAEQAVGRPTNLPTGPEAYEAR